MSDEFKVQWSVSLPPAAQYAKGHMLNLRGQTVAEVDELLDAVLEGEGAFLAKAVEVGTLLISAQAVSLPEQPASQEKGQPEKQDEGPVGQVKFCTHGKRVFKEGHGAKGKWQGYFCPEKVRANQCAVEWVDNK